MDEHFVETLFALRVVSYHLFNADTTQLCGSCAELGWELIVADVLVMVLC